MKAEHSGLEFPNSFSRVDFQESVSSGFLRAFEEELRTRRALSRRGF